MKVSAIGAERHARLNRVIERLMREGMEIVAVHPRDKGAVPQAFQRVWVRIPPGLQIRKRFGGYHVFPGEHGTGRNNLGRPYPDIPRGFPLPELGHYHIAHQRHFSGIKGPAAIRLNGILKTMLPAFFLKIAKIVFVHQLCHRHSQIPEDALRGFGVVEDPSGQCNHHRNQVIPAPLPELLRKALRPVLHADFIAVDQDFG